MLKLLLLTAAAACSVIVEARAENEARFTLRSGPERVGLVELFSSEGCSSCPPADKWMSSLTNAPGLWRDFVPVVFHVDYWDGLGWPDKFASREYTDRQTDYSRVWKSSSVYTPGFVFNGKEWRSRSIPKHDETSGGMLQAEPSTNGTVLVTYSPPKGAPTTLVAHAAWLGFGLINDIRRGENSGRTLRHDFLVLAHHERELPAEGTSRSVPIRLARPATAGTNKLALAVWVQDPRSGQVLQAAGNWAP